MEFPFTVERDGRKFEITSEYDDSSDTPWEREDGHGSVRKGKLDDNGYPIKEPGERVLYSSYRALLYDFAGAVKTAREEGWGPMVSKAGETARQRAHRAAEEDFARLRAWANGGWTYVGVIATEIGPRGLPDPNRSASVWGVESDAGEYFNTLAEELISEIVAEYPNAPEAPAADNAAADAEWMERATR